MPIHLKITCHGIMTFVPSTDDKHMAAFLPEAPAAIVPGQKAFVRFRRENYSDSNKRRPEGPHFLDAHVELDRERLSVVARVAATDAELKINRYNDPRSSTPTGRDRKSLIWSPDAEALNPGHGDLKSGYFANPLTVIPRLLARVDFTQGRLGTNGAEKIQVPFISKNVTQKRPIAREIVLELEIDADHFFLRSDPFDGARDPQRDLRFEGEGDVEIFIGNEPEADMYEETPPIDAIDVIDKVAAEEFIFYNNLSEHPSPDPLLPHFAARPGRYTKCSGLRCKATDAVKTFSMASIGSELPSVKGEAMPKWSVFAFIAVDNSLRNAGQLDLEEMAKADPAKVSVIAQIDLPEKKTRRLVVDTGGLTQLEELDNVNSGKPEVLTSFLDKCKSTRPGERTAVFILSHGTGLLDFKHKGSRPADKPVRFDFEDFFNRVSSIKSQQHNLQSAALLKEISAAYRMSTGHDDTSRDSLDNQELEAGVRDALKLEGPFSIIGIDACLMGLVEIAYQLRFCGAYFVASQEDLASAGWPYTEVLNALDDSVSPRDAALEIVKIYGQATQTQEGATLSAVDLHVMPQLARTLDYLGGALLGTVAEDIETLAAAREASRSFADYDYIDLHGFADALRTHFRDRASVRDAAAAVIKELGHAVLTTNIDRRKSRAGGLSVYVPNAPVEPEYHKLAMSKDAPRWHDFVVAYGNSF